MKKVKDEGGDDASVKGSEEHPGRQAASTGCLCVSHYPTFDAGVDMALNDHLIKPISWYDHAYDPSNCIGIWWSIWPLRSKSPGLPTPAKAWEALSYWGNLAPILPPMHWESSILSILVPPRTSEEGNVRVSPCPAPLVPSIKSMLCIVGVQMGTHNIDIIIAAIIIPHITTTEKSFDGL